MVRQLPFVWVWKIDHQTGKYICRLAGEEIREANGVSLRGREADEFFKDRGGSQVVDRIRRIVDGPSYYYCEGTVHEHFGRISIGERIAFPLSDNGVSADGVLGVTVFKASDLQDGCYPDAAQRCYLDLREGFPEMNLKA